MPMTLTLWYGSVQLIDLTNFIWYKYQTFHRLNFQEKLDWRMQWNESNLLWFRRKVQNSAHCKAN